MRATVTFLLLALAACRSTQEADESAVERAFDFAVEGNESVTTGALERALAFELDEFARSGHARPLADDAAHGARVLYRRKGFPFATVDFRVEEGEDRPRLVLTVDEGPRTVIDEDALEVRGVAEFTRAEIAAWFDGPRTGLLGRGPLLYVADRVEAVPEALRTEYVARGFLDVVVPPVGVEFSADRRTAKLTLEVREGLRYRVGDARLEQVGDLDEEVAASCEQVLRGARSDEDGPRVFHPRFPWELRGALHELLLRRGHPDPMVDVRVVPGAEPGLVDLAVTVHPGPRAVIDEVLVTGREKTRPSFVDSRIQFEPGDAWSVQGERESLRRLYQSGLFRRVSIELLPAQAPADEDPVARSFSVELEEAPSREYWIEPGYGSYEELRLRIGAREKNLFGTGRQLALEGALAVKATRGRVGLVDPWFLRTSLVGDLSATFEERENPSFTERESGFGAFLTQPWTRAQATTFGYQFRSTAITDFEAITGEVAESLEDVDLSSLRLSHRYDTRSPVFLPTVGSYFEGSLEWGDDTLGSELDFLRTTVAGATYLPLREGTVLAASLRLGVIAPTAADATIPLQERFFNGGSNAVRSFEQDQLGPKDPDGDPVGGESYKTASLELRQRLGESHWELAAFYDAGDVQSQAADWASFDDFGTALGLGLRYLLPVGPARLDLAWNPDASGDEDELVLHLALGISF